MAVPPPPPWYKLLLISSYSLMHFIYKILRGKNLFLHVWSSHNNIVLPIRSTMTEFPSMREKPNSTQGKNGALKVKRPKKFMRTYGFLLLQTYTSMMVNAWPRKTKLTNRAMIWMQKLRNSSSQKEGSMKLILVQIVYWDKKDLFCFASLIK